MRTPCPACNTRVIPRRDGTCPSCHAAIRAPAPQKPSAHTDAIARFRREVWQPAVDEMCATLKRDDKETRLIDGFDVAGDSAATALLREMHADCVEVRELGVRGKRALGDTLLVTEPDRDPKGRKRQFFSCVVFHIAPDGALCASPVPFYYLWRDHKVHKFLHRYVVEEEHLPVGRIDRYAIQNHFLNAYQFFKIVTVPRPLTDREAALVLHALGKKYAV